MQVMIKWFLRNIPFSQIYMNVLDLLMNDFFLKKVSHKVVSFRRNMSGCVIICLCGNLCREVHLFRLNYKNNSWNPMICKVSQLLRRVGLRYSKRTYYFKGNLLAVWNRTRRRNASTCFNLNLRTYFGHQWI